MKLLLLLPILLLSVVAVCQEPVNPTSRQERPLPTDYFSRLGVDYLIKDNPTPNADIIRAMPFPEYEKQRHETIDIEVTDVPSGYVIILFSEEKCRLNKQQ